MFWVKTADEATGKPATDPCTARGKVRIKKVVVKCSESFVKRERKDVSLLVAWRGQT